MSRRVELTKTALYAEAERRAGHDDWGEAPFEDGLDRLLYSIDTEANLSERGRLAFWNTIGGRLHQRLLLNRAEYRRMPTTVADRPALVIVGPARTGTTLLQRLLALDPSADYLRACDVMAPVPATLPGSEEDKAKIAAVRKQMAPPRELRKIHELDPEMAEEEIWLFHQMFWSILHPLVAHLPTYVSWFVEDADPVVAYRELRSLLTYVGQHRCGTHWVLKTPQHQFSLGALFDSFPNATIIWTHRDPLKFVPSMCSLSLTMRGEYSDWVDPGSIGREWLALMGEASERAMAARDAYSDRAVCDVHYDQLVQEPVAVIREIYEKCGMTFPEDMVTAIEGYLEESPKGKYGDHRYSAEQFGLTPDGIRGPFALYIERFEVPLTED